MGQNLDSTNTKKAKKKGIDITKKVGLFLLMVVIVGSLALCLSCIGKELPLPFQQTKAFNNSNIGVVNSACDDISNPQSVPDKYKNSTFAVVDNGGKTLNIITKDWTLFAQNAITGTNFKVDKISSIALYGDDVYVSTITLSDDKSTIQKENIIRANIYGESQEVIYEIKHDIDKNSQSNLAKSGLSNVSAETQNYYIDAVSKTNWIHDLKIRNDQLYFCESGPGVINVKQIPVELNTKQVTESPSTVLNCATGSAVMFSANYNPSSKNLIMLDWLNNVYSCQSGSAKQIASSDGYTTAIDQTNNGDILVLRYGHNPVQVYKSNKFQNIDNNTNVINLTNSDQLNWGEVLLDGSGSVIVVGKEISIGWFYGLKINARWIALGVLAAFFLLIIAYLIRTQIRLARRGLFHEVTVAVLIGLTCLVVCVFYSSYMYTSMIEQTKSKLSQQANIAFSAINDETKNAFEDIAKYIYAPEQNNLSEDLPDSVVEKATSLNKISDSIVNEYSKDNNVYLFSYYVRNPQTGEFICIADSEKAFHSNYDVDSIVRSEGENKSLNSLLVDAANSGDLSSDKTIDFEGEDISGKYYCSLKYILDANGQVCGVVSFKAYHDTTVEPIMQIINSIGLLILFCYLFFLVAYLEFRRMSISVRNYKRERKLQRKTKQSKKAFVNLVRPLSFVIALAFGADSALAVLVSKQLFDSSDMLADMTSLGLQDFMYGLPITLSCVGLVLGILLFTKLEKRFSIKLIFMVSSIVFTLSFIFSVQACIGKYFIMFAVAKFLIGFSCGCMKAELYTFTTVKEDEEERKNLLRDIGRSTMPAVVIGTLVCGYIVTFFDNYYVLYLFAAVCSCFVFVFGLLMIPNRAKFANDRDYLLLVRNATFSSSKKIVKWIFSPHVLIVIFFVIVPFAITKGYKSYMFPLYSNGVGMGKAEISIIYSMATMVSFLLVYVISDFNNRFTDSRKVVNALCILGFVFVLFRANTRIEWAIVAMFLTTIFGRTFGSAFRLGLTRICEKDGLNKSQIQPYIYLIEEVCNAMQVVLCGVMTTLGGKYACAIFGIYCLVCALIFGICVGRTAFDNKDAPVAAQELV